MGMHTYQAAGRLSAQRSTLLVALRALGLPPGLLGLRARALKRRLLAHGRVLRDGGPQQRVVAVVAVVLPPSSFRKDEDASS